MLACAELTLLSGNLAYIQVLRTELSLLQGLCEYLGVRARMFVCMCTCVHASVQEWICVHARACVFPPSVALSVSSSTPSLASL